MSIDFSFYQEQLAEAIQEKNPGLSEKVIQAFRVVPRHPFVDHYYLREPGKNRAWTRYEQEESAAWYEQVYRNDALITHVDQYGRPSSSSSQPGVMADMLQALDVQPGMRVLEIGTGSGYNAALLAYLVGDPCLIMTIDIDAEVIEQAKQRIPPVVGEGMTIVQADGIDGYAADTPYDRIILTASSPTLPSALLKQLAPQGILVGILQPKFAAFGGLLKAQKQSEQLHGTLLDIASFIALRPAEYAKRRIQIDFNAPLFASFPFDPQLFQPLAVRENHHFSFFLSYDFPGLYIFQRGEAFFFYQEAYPEGYIIFQQQPSPRVELRGEAIIACSLWNRLVRASSFWEHVGQPAITQYTFEMNSKGQTLSLHTPFGVVWPFGIW